MSSMFIPSQKSKRLSLDKLGQLEEELESNPLDYLKWQKLIDQLIIKDNQEQVRNAFNKYLNVFKFDGGSWCKYIKYELNRGEKEKVEDLFQQCLGITDNVELCRVYVDYVRSVTDFVTGGEKARGTVIQAFEFAINKVGLDIKSDSLWQDYIAFLKSWTPSANWEQQQKVDLIRKVYKKFLIIPTENIETSWSQYTKWENELNPSTASKFISEKSAEFMLARSWITEYNRITDKKLSRVLNPYGTNHEDVEKQLQYWLKWLELEKQNKLELKDDSLNDKRVQYVYKQATYALPFVPEIWFQYVKYLLFQNEEGNLQESIVMLKDGGLLLNPKSMLLSFQLAELYEKDNSFDNAKDVFNKLVGTLQKEYDEISGQLKELTDRVTPKPTEDTNDDEDDDDDDDDKNTFTNNNNNNGNGMDVDGDANGAKLPSLPQVYRISLTDSKQLLTLENEQRRLSDAITLTFTKFMVASKRAEGIKEARNIFKQARKFDKIGYQIYIESALIEHYADKKSTALKIFDLGKKFYATNGRFLLDYLDYLIMINDTDSMRTIIQSSDANFTKEITSLQEELQVVDIDPLTRKKKERELNTHKRYLKLLFKKYINFASRFLSLDITNSFTKKCEQLFPDDDPVDLFTDRYKLDNVNIIKKDELGHSYDDEVDDDDRARVKRRRLTSTFNDEDTKSTVKNIQESKNMIDEQSEEEASKKEDNFVGQSIVALMSALPNASYFGMPSENVFNSEKLVTLFANLSNIPS
ncbi:RNA14 mRNA 3'-end-processing protein RNA14 [Candida maltosa Xu316]|uniref:mRNA 3'-end-processing protein RNA14 n=1 Tax=Candida maltosa (strain Xu316) TaxID=1245528 RepID=M3K6S9_CANMX|nr:mRNA 3'-end-processing protein RNA14 [Candida maltosa Xu316]